MTRLVTRVWFLSFFTLSLIFSFALADPPSFYSVHQRRVHGVYQFTVLENHPSDPGHSEGYSVQVPGLSLESAQFDNEPGQAVLFGGGTTPLGLVVFSAATKHVHFAYYNDHGSVVRDSLFAGDLSGGVFDTAPDSDGITLTQRDGQVWRFQRGERTLSAQILIRPHDLATLYAARARGIARMMHDDPRQSFPEGFLVECCGQIQRAHYFRAPDGSRLIAAVSDSHLIILRPAAEGHTPPQFAQSPYQFYGEPLLLSSLMDPVQGRRVFRVQDFRVQGNRIWLLAQMSGRSLHRSLVVIDRSGEPGSLAVHYLEINSDRPIGGLLGFDESGHGLRVLSYDGRLSTVTVDEHGLRLTRDTETLYDGATLARLRQQLSFESPGSPMYTYLPPTPLHREHPLRFSPADVRGLLAPVLPSSQDTEGRIFDLDGTIYWLNAVLQRSPDESVRRMRPDAHQNLRSLLERSFALFPEEMAAIGFLCEPVPGSAHQRIRIAPRSESVFRLNRLVELLVSVSSCRVALRR